MSGTNEYIIRMTHKPDGITGMDLLPETVPEAIKLDPVESGELVLPGDTKEETLQVTLSNIRKYLENLTELASIARKISDSIDLDDSTVIASSKAIFTLKKLVNATTLDNVEIRNKIDEKAPINHATETIMYGAATDELYGHVELTDDYKIEIDQKALVTTQKAIVAMYNELMEEIEKKMPAVHADAVAATYGAGTSSMYGHVRLSDDYDATTAIDGTADDSVAASVYALCKAYTANANRLAKLEPRVDVLIAHNHDDRYLKLTGSSWTINTSGTCTVSDAMTGYLIFANTGTVNGVGRGIGGVNGTNDGWVVRGYQTAENAGCLELAVGDDGDEGIYCRQYTSSRIPFLTAAGTESGQNYREITLMEPNTGYTSLLGLNIGGNEALHKGNAESWLDNTVGICLPSSIGYNGTVNKSDGSGIRLKVSGYNEGICEGNGDGNGNGTANLIIRSWWGVGFVDSCFGGMKVGIDCRNSILFVNKLQSGTGTSVTATSHLQAASTFGVSGKSTFSDVLLISKNGLTSGETGSYTDDHHIKLHTNDGTYPSIELLREGYSDLTIRQGSSGHMQCGSCEAFFDVLDTGNSVDYFYNNYGLTKTSDGGTTTKGDFTGGRIHFGPSPCTGISNGNGDGEGNGTANLIIRSWWGIGFVDSCYGGMKVGIDCRNSILFVNNIKTASGATGASELTVHNTTAFSNGLRYICSSDSDGKPFVSKMIAATGYYTNVMTLKQMDYQDIGLVFGFYNTHGIFRPSTDNIFYLGNSSYRWSAIYAANGTIQTSDRNKKKDIVSLDTDKMLEFIKNLDPVSYKFKNGTSGRTHYGLIAQDVEDVMTSMDLTSMDFAGLCKDYPQNEYVDDDNKVTMVDDTTKPIEYSLRYDEFIAPMISVEQTLIKENEELKSRVTKLEEQLSSILELLETQKVG